MRERDYTLITGGAGFIGSNLADALLSDGEPVVILDNLSRAGVEANAQWLREKHGSRVRIDVGDVVDANRVAALVRNASRVYHLAAQVAVTTSLEDPLADLQSNLIGTFNVLEAARAMATPPPILFTSTNKVYGSMEDAKVVLRNQMYSYVDGRSGVSESAPLDFHSPYGCSKGAADQYVRDYARIFDIPTVVFRMSCIYGRRQFGTEDQGWVAHFARSILGSSEITVYGDGHQVRDVLWIEDLVRAMRQAIGRIDVTCGEIFNIGGGMSNAVSVNQVLERLMAITERIVPVRLAPWRPGDQRIYVSEIKKARDLLGWEPAVSWAHGLEQLVDWLEEADLSTPVLPLRPASRAARVAGVAH